MSKPLPSAWGGPVGEARLRSRVEDFCVTEQLGFEPSGEGEHAFLLLQKRHLNTAELVQRLATASDTAPRDIGYCGMKDRNAITRQWFSVGLAGRPPPDWRLLEESGDVQLIAATWHRRKLRRGVHRGNRFVLILRDLHAEPEALEARLRTLRARGAPNYFGEQRFGRGGATLAQAQRWAFQGKRRISRHKRSLFLSALRADLFNTMLSGRVAQGNWNQVCHGDVCMLRGTRSRFTCEQVDEAIIARADSGDLHPALPLWGRGASLAQAGDRLQGRESVCHFLEQAGLELDWRAARLMPDDFCWQFCDDGSLQLEFTLGAGSYATALLAELVRYNGGEATGDGSKTD